MPKKVSVHVQDTRSNDTEDPYSAEHFLSKDISVTQLECAQTVRHPVIKPSAGFRPEPKRKIVVQQKVNTSLEVLK